jgi:hypothetical protein
MSPARSERSAGTEQAQPPPPVAKPNTLFGLTTVPVPAVPVPPTPGPASNPELPPAPVLPPSPIAGGVLHEPFWHV